MVTAPVAVSWAGVWFSQGSGRDGLFASIAQDAAPPAFFLKQQDSGGDRYNSPELRAAAMHAAGDRFHVQIDTSAVTGGDFRLTVEGTGRPRATSTLAVTIPATGVGYVEAHQVVMDFEYVALYAAE